jgi:hypothetical protein
MTSCDDMRLLLGPFDDGELEPHEMEDVAFHVVGCAACKAALDDYRALGVALRCVLTAPALEHFAAEVGSRIEHCWLPPRVRLGRLKDVVGRLSAVFEIAVIAAATAVLTLVVAAPYARQVTTHEIQAPASLPVASAVQKIPLAVASANVAPVVQKAPLAVARADVAPPADLPEDVAMHESQELISQLGGGDSPSVAVWNEPRTGTTVVYIPNQP